MMEAEPRAGFDVLAASAASGSPRAADRSLLMEGLPLLGTIPRYPFNFSDVDIARVFTDPACQAVIQSDAFQRLADIRFLGAIDYLVHPNGFPGHRRHTRFHHSLGVGCLALSACRMLALDAAETRYVVVAALTHDLGHAPLSHSLESVFKHRFGIAHHAAGERILRGQAPIGRSLPRILAAHKVDPERVLALISGRDSGLAVSLFASPINIDTIEAIARSYTYASGRAVETAPAVVLQAALRYAGPRDQVVLDQFWHLKNAVYRHIINGRTGLLADYLARNYMERHIHMFSADSYFQDEKTMRRQHGGLFDLLTKARSPSELRDYLGRESLDELVEASSRHFFIDAGESDLVRRYRQSRSLRLIEAQKLIPVFPGCHPREDWLQADLDDFNANYSFQF
jgi:HD superfamily phosphohydrolase